MTSWTVVEHKYCTESKTSLTRCGVVLRLFDSPSWVHHPNRALAVDVGPFVIRDSHPVRCSNMSAPRGAHRASHDERVVLVTGSSSGIGHAVARRLTRSSRDGKRVRVIATMRSPDDCARPAIDALRQSGCDIYPLDLTDDGSVQAARHYVDSQYGHCDAIVTAAGTGTAGNIETVPFHDALQVFDVNVWGVMRVARAFAPLLRGRHCRGQGAANAGASDGECGMCEKHAVFLAVSSQSGVCGLPYNDIYAASKHALEGMLESWRYTANVSAATDGSRYVHIAVVNPGATRTAYGDRLVARAERNGSVGDGARAWAEEVQRRVAEGQPPDECAAVVESVMEMAFSYHCRVPDRVHGHPEPAIPFRNPTSAQSKRVVDGVLRDPAGTSEVYAERFALGRELDRRVQDGEIGSGKRSSLKGNN